MTSAAHREPAGGGRRWWTYQSERFPLLGHGSLILAFSFCAVSFSHQLRGEPGLPDWRAVVVAFATCFLFFLQLRIADEFKDYEEDLAYRPYRPVQRGLVSLRELAGVFAVAAVVQLGLAIWRDPRLTVFLAITWAYLAAMSREFGVRAWLKPRPVAYMLSHMLIMPLIDLYATATQWLPDGPVRPPAGLAWFLAASFFNGLVIEIGRKIRSPMDEERGVGTYSAVWGIGTAVVAWWAAVGATGACMVAAAMRVDAAAWVLGVIAILLPLVAAVGLRQVRRPTPHSGKRIEAVSAAWSIGMYTSLGVLPLLAHRLG